MKWIAATMATAALTATAAQAESFTYTIAFNPPEMIGGMGPADDLRGQGGIIEGPYNTVNENGEQFTGMVKCVGMDQPEGSIFELHLSCTATASENAGSSSLVYGCNEMPENRGWSCVGGMEGRSGPRQGQGGTLTLHLKQGTSNGTGQWYE